jgi:hypothetical protein
LTDQNCKTAIIMASAIESSFVAQPLHFPHLK